MKSKNWHLLFCIALIYFFGCNKISDPYKTEVLIIGGGTSGTAAAISSARMGVSTLLLNEHPWLGGMLTSAGVSAVDGNTKLLSGLWGEFRDSLVNRYGSPQGLKTGWVSNHLFEPAVGAAVFLNMAKKEPNLTLWMKTKWESIRKHPEGWLVSGYKNNTPFQVIAKQLIDATELGDVAKSLGVPYDIGMDSRDRFNEKIAPENENDIIQDLTYVLILKEYNQPVSVEKPPGYDASLFYCATESEKCKDAEKMNRILWPKDKMINYGALPNKKYMINWPINGNDYYANGIELTHSEREVLYEKAKLKSKQFLYYLQTDLGFTHLGISKEFPTKDGFPFMPYHRESRRIHGLTTLTINHLADPYSQKKPLYRTGIAVGDYPVDHHHDAHPNANELPELHFYPVPSYSVPLGCLIPETVDHLLVTEKSISISNIVNGTTRLQPVVIQLGQAAGITAALAHLQKVTPREVPVREVQKNLLSQGGYLLPYLDVPKTDPFFKVYQKIGATGILRGTGKNVGWENQTWLYPELPLKTKEVYLTSWEGYFDLSFPQNPTVVNILNWFKKSLPENELPSWLSTTSTVKKHFSFLAFEDSALITRGQFAVIMDALFDPFSREVNFLGEFVNSTPSE